MLKFTIVLKSTLLKLQSDLKVLLRSIVLLQTVLSIMDMVGEQTSKIQQIFCYKIISGSILDLLEQQLISLGISLLITTQWLKLLREPLSKQILNLLTRVELWPYAPIMNQLARTLASQTTSLQDLCLLDLSSWVMIVVIQTLESSETTLLIQSPGTKWATEPLSTQIQQSHHIHSVMKDLTSRVINAITRALLEPTRVKKSNLVK